MQNYVKFKITTRSNLFIGGAPAPFEIGGIDQQTVTDHDGFPCIPGSSIKGALRAIVHEDDSEMAKEIKSMYTMYLESLEEANKEYIKALVHEVEARDRIKERYGKAKNELSVEYLFGIEGFNNTPKYSFDNLLLCDEFRDIKSCFSIDMKNRIETKGDAPESKPRTYKVARSGLVFEGEIKLWRIELLGEKAIDLCKRYLCYNLLKFNDGIYRLGNSKSRGYGKIEVSILEESGNPE